MAAASDRGDASGSLVGVSDCDLLVRNEELRGGGQEQQEDEDVTPLGEEEPRALLPSAMSPAASSFPADICKSGGVLTSSAQLQQRGECDDADDGLLLSTDALLFTLEEEEELLLLDGANADTIDLTDLDFVALSGVIGDSHEETQTDHWNLVPAASKEVIAPSCVEAKPQKAPVLTASTSSEEAQPLPRVRPIWTMQHAPALPFLIPASALQTATTKKPNSSGGRKRVKDELEYLRQHVSDLEEQLRRVKPRSPDAELSRAQEMQNNQNGANDSPSLVLSPQLLSEPLSSALWKRVATHQLDGRRKSEAENARLRSLLEAQLQLARSLARTLRKRPNLADIDPMLSQSEVKWRQLTPHGDAATSAIFAHLKERIGPLYACLDDVLQECGVNAEKREMRESQVKMDAYGRLFLEIVDTTIVPFDLQSSSRGYWKTFSDSSREELRYGMCTLKLLDVTSDTLCAQFSASLPVQHTEALVKGHTIGKQFIEEGRVVSVWANLGELESSLFGSERITLRESGWTVIKAVPSTGCGDESPSTVIQTIVRMTPDVGRDQVNESFVSETQSNLVGVLTDLVLGSFRQNLDTMHQLIENMIISEMAKA